MSQSLSPLRTASFYEVSNTGRPLVKVGMASDPFFA